MCDLEKTERIKAVAERINLFKITTAAMMKACEEFVTLTAEVWFFNFFFLENILKIFTKSHWNLIMYLLSNIH